MIKGVMGVYCSRHSNCRYKQECWIWPWWWWPKAGQSSDTICSSVQRPDYFAILKSPKIFLSLSPFDFFSIIFEFRSREIIIISKKPFFRTTRWKEFPQNYLFRPPSAHFVKPDSRVVFHISRHHRRRRLNLRLTHRSTRNIAC